MSYRASSLLLAVSVLLAFPFVVSSPYYLHLLVMILIYAIVLLGLDVLFGYTGEVSLGHAALFGVGAYTAGVLVYQNYEIGLVLTLPVGILVAVVFGFVLALPSLRVSGPYLAMVTLAFGTIIQILFNEMTWLTNGPLGISLHKPLLLAGLGRWSDVLPFLKVSLPRMKEIQFYYLVLGCFSASLLVVDRLLRSYLGRAFQALRDSPIASDCMGVSVYRHKVYAFVISAGFAGLAGVLFAYSEQYIAPNNFSFELTIQFLLGVAVGGRRSRTGPLIGAAIIVFLPNLLADVLLFRVAAAVIAFAATVSAFVLFRRGAFNVRSSVPVALCIGFFLLSLKLERTTDVRLAIFGIMILFVIYYVPDGIVGLFRAVLGRFEESSNGGKDRPPLPREAKELILSVPKGGLQTGLDANNLVMQFGGLKALDGVSVAIDPGKVHGLIGPNGSGKSTMMNVLSGIYVPIAGEIFLDEQRITGMPPARIASLGLARTFQNVQLFGGMSAIENVLVGLHHRYHSNFVDVALSTPRHKREEASARRRASELLDLVGLTVVAHEDARSLPYGKQRLLEIARALALDPKLLLLDEPAAGLTAPDIEELITLIRKLHEGGLTIVLIEHHMDVVMSLCDRITVLDFGQKIAEGTPDEIRSNPRVIEAYLGSVSAAAA